MSAAESQPSRAPCSETRLSRAARTAVSVEEPRPSSPLRSSPEVACTASMSSRVLVRLPLWARARVEPAAGPSIGWAFSQVVAPWVA